MHRGGTRWPWIVGLLVLLLGTRAAQQHALPSHATAGMAEVAVVRSGADVEAAVREAVARTGGLAAVVAPGDVVAIKVNLVLDAPVSSGIVTDPAVARAVVRLAREAGAEQVLIIEGTAQYGTGDANRNRFATRAAFQAAGYDTNGDMVDDVTGAPLIDLNDSGGTDVADPARVRQVTVPTGLIRKEYWLPNTILDADVLISVPVLKNHYLAGLTLGMKNQIGLLPADLYHGPGNIYGKHSLSHGPVELDQHIIDLNIARRPDFVVADGQRGMIDGPIGSTVIAPPMGLILAGRDVVAVDTVGALVVGYDPRAIPYLQLAGQHGLGQGDTAYIRVLGPPLNDVRRDFPAPYADSPARRSDSHPPVVSLVHPEGTAWTGTVTVAAQVTDDDQVARLELYLDEQRVGQVTAPPFEIVLDTAHYAPGKHIVRLVAFDRALNQAAVSRNVDLVVPAAPATATPVPTNTPLPPTSTPPPADTPVPPTLAPPTDTPALPTLTPPAPTASSVLPTLPPLPPTETAPVSPASSSTTPVPTAAQVARAVEQPEPVEDTVIPAAPAPRWMVALIVVLLILLVIVLIALIASIKLMRRGA